jgi:putative spermidine/putrescine transport system ATP-binding protein
MNAIPENAGTRVRLTGCAKTFTGNVQALRPTDIEVAPGEILGLLGPSGCGKTTMLRIMAGLESPDEGGQVKFDDDDVTARPIERRNVGMVFQSYALFPNMNVRANVGYGLKVAGLSRAEIDRRVDEVLALCQLGEFASRPIDALSGGQRQRVALARAVAPRPRVLLLDEPLSALDAALREQLRDELALLLRQLSITAVFVTHDQAEAMAIADRVAVMRGGEILQIDRPETLYRKPANGFVATFVGGANRLAGTVADGAIKLPGGRLPLPPGDGGVAYVRPENFRIADPAAPDALRGRVSGRIFIGMHYRLTVTGIANEPVTVVTADPSPPEIGTEIGLTANAESILLLGENA